MMTASQRARKASGTAANRRQPVQPRPVLLGLYRTEVSGFGECARMHPDAGDSAPFLPRDIYRALDFHPSFDDLPSEDEYGKHRLAAPREVRV